MGSILLFEVKPAIEIQCIVSHAYEHFHGLPPGGQRQAQHMRPLTGQWIAFPGIP
jgi:hypothetical protein